MRVYNLCLFSSLFYGHQVSFQFPSDRKSLQEKATRFFKEENYLCSSVTSIRLGQLVSKRLPMHHQDYLVSIIWLVFMSGFMKARLKD